ncbi:hypothetical protein GCM10029992_02370 [Glycomyces albus]
MVKSGPPEDAPTPSAALRELVAGGNVASQYATYDFEGDSTPFLVVGAAIEQVVDFELYAFYPLDSQQDAIALLRTNLALAGIALVLLLGVIAALVTRLVVTPSARPRAPPSAWPPGSCTNAWRYAARTTWPAWPAPSTSWPRTSRARSAGSRRCR